MNSSNSNRKSKENEPKDPRLCNFPDVNLVLVALQHLNDGGTAPFADEVRNAFDQGDLQTLSSFLDDLDYDAFVDYIDQNNLEPAVRQALRAMPADIESWVRSAQPDLAGLQIAANGPVMTPWGNGSDWMVLLSGTDEQGADEHLKEVLDPLVPVAWEWIEKEPDVETWEVKVTSWESSPDSALA